MDVLQREYGSLLRAQPEPEYSVSLEIDLEQAPAEGGQSFCQFYRDLLSVLPVLYRGTGELYQVSLAVEAECARRAI